MARTREFDPETALDAAMKVFWKNGYYATSIEELVEATGVSRYGLYSVYDSKHGLFLAALDRYRETVVTDLTTVLHQPDASIDVITSLILTLGDFSAKPSGRIGCLLWNTASEVAPHDKLAAKKTADFRTYFRKGFESALSNAVRKKELPRTFDTQREADFLTGVVQTLAVFARSHAEPRVIANFVDVSLATLR